MDEVVKKIIVNKLEEWGDESISVAKLSELRDEITKETGKHKFLPYTNLRKWVREVKKEIKLDEPKKKKSSKKNTTQKGEKVKTLNPPAQRAIISPFADRVFFQNFTYELTTMRKTMERISKQLDELERQVNDLREKDPEN